jgi:hypothetical protein
VTVKWFHTRDGVFPTLLFFGVSASPIDVSVTRSVITVPKESVDQKSMVVLDQIRSNLYLKQDRNKFYY